MLTSKSPKEVAKVALASGKEAFSDYSHKYSPHIYTQAQLFACLVLKEFEKKDYRGVSQLLIDCSDLRDVIELPKVPHYTTLQKASVRLLALRCVRKLLDKTIRKICRRNNGNKLVPYAAGDSTGFDSHHASRYFIWRRDNRQEDEKRGKNRVSYQHYGKLMVMVCCATHAILGVVASQGPTPDIDQLDELMDEVPNFVRIKHVVLDAGFDSAHNHELLREDNGMRSTIPPEHGRPPKDPNALPKNKWRRLMKRLFRNGRPRSYRKRPQVETVISMMKRNFGPALRGRSYQSRNRDMYLRSVTHNVALALIWVFYRALPTP